MNQNIEQILQAQSPYPLLKPKEVENIKYQNMYEDHGYMSYPSKKIHTNEDNFSFQLGSYEKDSQNYSPPKTLIKDDGLMTSQKYMGHADIESYSLTDKKKKRRFTEIGSHSLRNLKKEFEHKDDSETGREKALSSLSDWINRRITGYLIFQNTLNTNGNEKSTYREAGVHLNSVAGQKWKSLTESEKEEYKVIAKEYRKSFRREIEEYENYEDLTDLIEKLDYKIKNLRKE